MKKIAVYLIAVMVLTSLPVFACGSSCGGDKDKDKDKGDQAFTVNAQDLCGGSGCDKDKDKDKDEDKDEDKD